MTLTSSAADRAQQDYGTTYDASGQQPDQHTNVGTSERLLSGVGGAVLTYLGIKQRSIPGLLLAGAGAMLMQRGATGHCGVYESLGVDTAHGGEPASPDEYFERGTHASFVVTINKPAGELFRFWRDFS